MLVLLMDQNQYAYGQAPAIELDQQSRGQFIARTYAHLFGAVLAFTGLEIALFKTGAAENIARLLMSGSWLIVLGAFTIVSWLARSAAYGAKSKAAQYAALTGYVVAQAVIFVPLLYLANKVAPGAITCAAAVTLLAFAGLTLLVFSTRKDFSFMRGILMWGGIIALVLIIAGSIFGFQLGTFFMVAMVALAGGSILYDTSNVLHHFPADKHVAAALELFASVALMLWYVIQLFISRR